MKLHKDLERDCTGSSGFCYASFPFSFKLFSLPRIVGFMNACCCCLVLEFVSSSTMLSSALQLMSKLCLKCFVKTSGKLCHCQVSRKHVLAFCLLWFKNYAAEKEIWVYFAFAFFLQCLSWLQTRIRLCPIMLFQFLTAFSSILLLLSGVFLHHLPSLNTFCFNFCTCKLHRFLDSKVLINMLDILCFLEKS